MTTYSDEYLNHYADRFVAMRLSLYGVRLDQYLANPAHYEALAMEPLPLLPQQRAVQARLDEADKVAAEVAHLPQRNGTTVEPLRHHRHPRRGTPALSALFARRVK